MINKILHLFGLAKAGTLSQEKASQSNQNIGKPVPEIAILEQEAEQGLYNFHVVSVDDMRKHPDAINDMYTGVTDGFLIKNFLSEKEVDRLLKKLDEVMSSKEELANTSVGFTYPTVFAEYSLRIAALPESEQADAVAKYFANNNRYLETFATEYQVDLFTRINDFFASVGGGRNVELLKGVNDQGNYPFTTFRYLLPAKGLMSIHCANYFGETFKKFYGHITAKVAAKNQMSFFIMLHESEEGGELSLFNFRWKDGQAKCDPNEDNEIIQPDGSKVYVQTDPSIRKNKLRPRKGDMILFQGGNIWHRVERIKGNLPRITLGGFLSLSHDGKTVYYWS